MNFVVQHNDGNFKTVKLGLGVAELNAQIRV